MKKNLLSKVKKYKSEILTFFLILLFILVAGIKIDEKIFFLGLVFVLIYAALLVALQLTFKGKISEKRAHIIC